MAAPPTASASASLNARHRLHVGFSAGAGSTAWGFDSPSLEYFDIQITESGEASFGAFLDVDVALLPWMSVGPAVAVRWYEELRDHSAPSVVDLGLNLKFGGAVLAGKAWLYGCLKGGWTYHNHRSTDVNDLFQHPHSESASPRQQRAIAALREQQRADYLDAQAAARVNAWHVGVSAGFDVLLSDPIGITIQLGWRRRVVNSLFAPSVGTLVLGIETTVDEATLDIGMTFALN